MPTVTRETYQVRVKPGNNPELAAARMAKYTIERWMPDHAGGAPPLLGPGLARLLLPYFHRADPTMLRVDTTQDRPEIQEVWR